MDPGIALDSGMIFGGDFRVVRKLSEGGMGAVWIAEQLSTGKERALKVMHPQMVADARLRERFVQEARIGARVESDHIVEVVAAGVDAGSGAPWLAMELLKGETLASRLERGPLDRAAAAEMFSQLSHALVAAHDAHIVHRDLKPDNLFLATPRRAGVPFMVKVLDFGIAKLVLESHSKHTASIGTPLWMAPEQTEIGKAIVPATDVWAIGLIAYQVLTGRHYWVSANTAGTGALQLMREVLVDPLESASTRAGQYGVAHLLPAGFDAWFERCVQRSIDARYRDAREAFGALEAVLGSARPGAATAPLPAPPIVAVVPPAPQRTVEMAPRPSTEVMPAPRIPTEVVPPPRGPRPDERTPYSASATAPVEEDDARPAKKEFPRGPFIIAGLALVAATGLYLVVRKDDSEGKPSNATTATTTTTASTTAPVAPDPKPLQKPTAIPSGTDAATEANRLEKLDIVLGTGPEAKTGDTISVHYVGSLADGTKFDDTGGKDPFVFRLGAGEVIAGWDQGIVGMKVGGRRGLIIGPALAYGAQGSPPKIPPNATLGFTVDLVSVKGATAPTIATAPTVAPKTTTTATATTTAAPTAATTTSIAAAPTAGNCPSYKGDYSAATKNSDYECVRTILLPRLNAGSISAGEARYLKAACTMLSDISCAKRAAEKM